MTTELTQLRDVVRSFAAERDWDQFHSPKNLASALSVEAAELLEHFQWLTEEQSRQLGSSVPLPDSSQSDESRVPNHESRRLAVRHELADVLIYLVRLADKLDVDLMAAAHEKIALNAQKYPVEKAKGSMRKYTDL